MPLISAVGEKLFLGEPSRSQYQFAESSEAERLRMAYQEYIMKNRRLSDDKQGNSSVASEEKIHDVSQAQIIKKNVKRNGSDVKDKVCFKRKKAKVRVHNIFLFSLAQLKIKLVASLILFK